MKVKKSLIFIAIALLLLIPIIDFDNSIHEENGLYLMENNEKMNNIPNIPPNLPLDLITDYTPPNEPVLGEEEAVVIMIDFSDQPGVKSKAYFENMLFGGNDGAMDNYYEEVSYNQFTVSGTIVGTGWYRSSHLMIWYGADDVDHDDLFGDIYDLTVEAAILAWLAGDIDFSQYDKDHDGDVDHLIIIHSGDDQAASGVSTDIWSHRASVSPPQCFITLDGVCINSYTMVSETSGMGTFAHEFGHDIGLPDLYDGDYLEYYAQNWSLMASGSYNDGQAHPSHMMAWSKMQLGWIETAKVETVVDGRWRSIILDPLESNTDGTQVIKLPITSNTYFLIENRQKIGYDTYIPDEGIIITFVNDSLDTYEGIVRIQDSRIVTPTVNDGEYSVGSGEVVIYRNLTEGLDISICKKIGNSYEIFIDRFSGSYTNLVIAPNTIWTGTFDNVQPGRIIVWDFYETNSRVVDFWIEKEGSPTKYMDKYGITSDAGTFRVPEYGNWSIVITNNDLGTGRDIEYDFFVFSLPNIQIVSFFELPSLIYEGEYFDLLLFVGNTGGSYEDTANATIILPDGLSAVNLTQDIGIIDYWDIPMVSWRIYAEKTGNYEIQVNVTSTWGGSVIENETIVVEEDPLKTLLPLLLISVSMAASTRSDFIMPTILIGAAASGVIIISIIMIKIKKGKDPIYYPD